jgi:glucans biosynthesis protein C
VAEERIHYLDWLKVLIVYGICVFHVSLVFAITVWLVSNHQHSLVLSAFTGFTFPWGIPAMFLIAGADSWFALRTHSPAKFVRGRFLRLMVPMLAGLVVLSPFQRFVTSQNPPPPLSGLWQFYVDFFRGFRVDWTLQWVSRYWLHLWFLGYLFAISLAALPVLLWLRTAGGRRLRSWLAGVAGRRGGLFLLALPLLVSQVLLRPLFPAYQSWADVATYTVIFLWGAVLFGDRGFEAAIRRQIRLNLVVGVVSILGVGTLLFLAPGHQPEDARVPAVLRVLYALLWGLDIWCWLLAVLYLGIRWLDFPKRALTYARESVLPFYIIHHPVVLLVASFVVTWNLGVWPKFGVLLAAAFAITLTLYEFGVRRWGPMRTLFGLKPLSRGRLAEPVRRPGRIVEAPRSPRPAAPSGRYVPRAR